MVKVNHINYIEIYVNLIYIKNPNNSKNPQYTLPLPVYITPYTNIRF